VKGAFAGPELADATLGWMLRTFRSHGDNPEPDKVIAYQVQRVLTAGGCGDPAFWEMVALGYARSGREGVRVALALPDRGDHAPAARASPARARGPAPSRSGGAPEARTALRVRRRYSVGGDKSSRRGATR